MKTSRRVYALAAALAVVLTASCWRHPQDVDPMGAVKRGSIGLPVLELRWKKTVIDHGDEHGMQEFASPAIYHDRLFIGSRGGTLFALDRRRGDVIWKKDVGAMSAQPLVDRGRVYVGTDDGIMVCLDTLDGEEKWRYPTRGAILRTPVLADDMVLFSNDSDQVYALDRDKGTYRWQYKTDMPEEYTLRGHAGVALSGDLVITGFANGTVVALRTATGSVAWMTSLKGKSDQFVDVDSRPAVIGDTVFVASSSGGVHAVDRTTGLIRWQMDVKGAGTVVADGNRLYFAAADEGMYATDLGGNVFWRQGTRGGGEPADPLVTGDYVIYTLSEDGLFVVDKRTGVVREFFDPGYGISAAPVLDDDMLYVMSNSGILYALNIERFHDDG
jgi:outer membrane protein assembly factor BamB